MIKYLIALLCTLISVNTHLANALDYLPLTLVNNSQCIGDDNVFILVKGINPATKQDCYLNFDLQNGKGYYYDVEPSTSSFDHTYRLSDLPKQLFLPQLTSGRIYFSISTLMDLLVDSETGKIQDPDALNSKDPNYYTLYDKVEFTYTSLGNPEIAMNPTAVDFFSLPLYVELQTNRGTQFSGFPQKRTEIFSKVRKIFAKEDRTSKRLWDRLLITFKDPYAGSEFSDLRIASPGKAMRASPAIFDAHYLDNSEQGFNWIETVWKGYYKNHPLKIDATELPPPHNKIYTGCVNAANQFIFTDAGGSKVIKIELPNDSVPFFAAAGGTFDAPNNTPQAIIIRNLTAAFSAGLLPLDTSNQALNQKMFKEKQNQYYTHNPLLSSDALAAGPWYDLYSKALHSFGNHIYTFAYDDVLGIDGTTTANMKDFPSATITLGDLSETYIPDPLSDATRYSITVHVSANNPVKYNGQVLANNQLLSNVAVPFTVEMLDAGRRPVIAHIYIKYPQVKPHFNGAQGIVIHSQGPASATISFPG